MCLQHVDGHNVLCDETQLNETTLSVFKKICIFVSINQSIKHLFTIKEFKKIQMFFKKRLQFLTSGETTK